MKTVGEAFAVAVRDHVATLREAEGMIRGGGGVEGVHRMRTSSRRLRSAVKYLGAHLPVATRAALQAGLKGLMAALGPVRDHDVLIGEIAKTPGIAAADAASLAEAVRKRRERPALGMLEWLSGPRHRALLDGLEEAAHLAGSVPVTAAGPARITKAIAAVVASKPAWGSAADEALHDTRKAVKKLRYALEAFQPAYGKAMGRMIEACRDLQEALGAVQDAAMFGEQLRGLRTFAAGQFIATVRGAAEAVKARLPKVWERALGRRMLGRLGAHLLRRIALEPEAETVELKAVV
jgi:CHAD domain-containing protein